MYMSENEENTSTTFRDSDNSKLIRHSSKDLHDAESYIFFLKMTDIHKLENFKGVSVSVAMNEVANMRALLFQRVLFFLFEFIIVVICYRFAK